MSVETGWVASAKYKKGLDPLGVQQPCIAIYSTLVPGITNVTDRAIYFSFGPWFAWAFARRYPKATEKEFVQFLRRAEVLLTLISLRHSQVSDDEHPEDHSLAMVGADTLKPMLEGLKEEGEIRLSKFSGLEESKNRYFKNRRGGLGQYYLGVLRDEYQLLAETKDRGIDFTIERGAPMGELVSKGIDEEHFFRCLTKDRIHLSDLDRLDKCCPCGLLKKSRLGELGLLRDIVLGNRPDTSANAEMRRASLALILEFFSKANGIAQTYQASMYDFLCACYSGKLNSGQRWIVSPTLSETARVWRFYFRSEMLSIAMQRLFRAALLTCEVASARLPSVQFAASLCCSSPPFSLALKRLPAASYSDLMSRYSKILPSIEDDSNENHELMLWSNDSVDERTDDENIKAALSLLLTLLARGAGSTDTFKTTIGGQQIRSDFYPINADSIAERSTREWNIMSRTEWATDLLSWILTTHRHVSFRKLSQSGDDTRRLRMGDDGLYVYGDPVEVANTQPRLKQAIRLLLDLGLLTHSDRGCLPILTKAGDEFLKVVQHGG